MSLGENIRDHRIKKSMTQKELGDVLFVTAQAVSRWENNEVEPSIEMLKNIANYFEISLEDLIMGKQKEKVEETPAPEVVVAPVIKEEKEVEVEKMPIVAQCVVCKTPLRAGNHIHYPKKRSGRSTYQDMSRPTCQKCHDKQVKARAEYIKSENIRQSKVRRIHGFIWGSLAGAITLAVFISLIVTGNLPMALASAIFLTIFATYGMFAFIFSIIIDNNFVRDLFDNIAGFSIRVPGIIFSLDLDGIIWFLTVKLVLFILGFIFSIILFIVAIVVCAALSMFVFPFAITWSFTKPEKTGEGSDL